MAGTELRATTNTSFDAARETVRSLLAQVSRDECRTRHRIGVILRDVSRAIDTYGARAVERLAEDLEVGTATLYRCMSVAEAWSEIELKALTARTNRRGEPLTWSHLTALARIPSGKARGRWVDRTLEQGWTTRELIQHLTGERDAGPPSGVTLSEERPREGAVSVALTECAQNASRAKVQLRVAREALQRRLEDDESYDDRVLERAIREHEELRVETEATLACLREAGRVSGVRIRVAGKAAESRAPGASGRVRYAK